MTWTDRCWIPLLDHAQGSCLLALSCRVTPICCRQHAKQGASTKQAGMHVSDPRTKLCASCQNARSCRAPADSVDSELDNGTPGKHPAAGSMLEEGPRLTRPGRGPFLLPRNTHVDTHHADSDSGLGSGRGPLPGPRFGYGAGLGQPREPKIPSHIHRGGRVPLAAGQLAPAQRPRRQF